MELTKSSLEKFSLKREIFSFIGHFNVDPTLHAKSRLHRLKLELSRATEIKARDYSYHHASALNIGSKTPEKCLRQLAYSVANDKPDKTNWAELFLNKFETGHDAHAKYQGWLSYIYGEKFESEIPFRVSLLNMGGTCDGVLTVELDGTDREIGIEIKTASTSVITKLKKPSNRYLDQGATYVHSLGLDAIIFLYEDKNTQQLYEFPYLASELLTRWQRIEERITGVNDHLKRGTWPQRMRSSDCKECAFRAECRPYAQRPINYRSLQPRLRQVIGKG